MSHGRSSRSGSSKQPPHQGTGAHKDETLPSRPFSLPPGYYEYYGIRPPEKAQGAIQTKRPGLHQDPSVSRGVLEYYGIVPRSPSDPSPHPAESRDGAQTAPAQEALPAASAAPAPAEPMAIQAKSGGSASRSETEQIHEAAARGTSGPSGALPYLDQIQKSFGRHDLSHVKAHTDSQAAAGSQAMGAEAFTTGEHVAFAGTPSLHTAAHEAAHVIQQRAGVQLKGGVGEVGDRYEQHADAVADRVARGESVEAMLDAYAGPRPHGETGQPHPIARSSAGAVTQAKAADATEASPAPHKKDDAAGDADRAIALLDALLARTQGERRQAPDAQAPNEGGETPRAMDASQPEPPEIAQVRETRQRLLALRASGPPEELARAVRPILAALEGKEPTAQEAAATPAGPDVQRMAAAAALPLAAAGPPGWVVLGVLAIGTLAIGAMAYSQSQSQTRAEPRTVTRTDQERPMHRGRLQVQGGGLELSFHWARSVPMTKAEATAGLIGLRATLSRQQLSLRDEAFARALGFIQATLATTPPPVIRKFQNRNLPRDQRDARVDVEIRTGVAFV
jgi:hypothetical protein